MLFPQGLIYFMVQLAVQIHNPFSQLVVESVNFIDFEFDQVCFGMVKVLLNFLGLTYGYDR